MPPTTEQKKALLVASPIQAPFDEPIPSDIATEERAPADPLEHFKKHQCGNGHCNWDPDKIVFSMDNKRWILKCMDCAKGGFPSWFTITGSALAVQEAAGRVESAKVQK
jgi:hypothetical protein